ncbi:hypothetical protein SASPL_129546 [Salvia splendens]|uniref:Uncharacterized protein n=1 Tax=Salvia splendens TaxID=180675 RepID=A0A8X8ZPI9_SALSN|nr:hypothetical protein SASPL_129546 [Salvia splendens]
MSPLSPSWGRTLCTYPIKANELIERQVPPLQQEIEELRELVKEQLVAHSEFVSTSVLAKIGARNFYYIKKIKIKHGRDNIFLAMWAEVSFFFVYMFEMAGTIIKRTVHNNFSGLFFGLPFTKPNPEFVQSVKNQFSSESSKLLLVCQEGLRYHFAMNFDPSGYQNIACITSGLQSVKPGTFDAIGSMELQDAGKAGLIQVQGKISAVLGTVLICAFLFITFFPDQAEKLFQLAPTS